MQRTIAMGPKYMPYRIARISKYRTSTRVGYGIWSKHKFEMTYAHIRKEK